jgi:hypothetical protein
VLTHLFKGRDRKLLGLTLVVEGTVETRLEGEAVHDAEFPPEDDASCFFLGTLDSEFAREKSEF